MRNFIHAIKHSPKNNSKTKKSIHTPEFKPIDENNTTKKKNQNRNLKTMVSTPLELNHFRTNIIFNIKRKEFYKHIIHLQRPSKNISNTNSHKEKIFPNKNTFIFPTRTSQNIFPSQRLELHQKQFQHCFTQQH